VKPTRDSRYLAWVRTLPCVICGFTRGIEASHTGLRGLGQKSADTSAIPLCVPHHRTGKDSYHKLGARKFAQVHNLDIPGIVERLNLKPVIRIESGAFVGHLEDRRYALGGIHAGVGWRELELSFLPLYLHSVPSFRRRELTLGILKISTAFYPDSMDSLNGHESASRFSAPRAP